MTESAKEYGMALFDLAKEKGMTDAYADSLKIVSEVLKSNPDYLDVISSPRLTSRERISSAEAVFGGLVHEDVMACLALLCAKCRIRWFDSCLDEYMRLYDDLHRISVARIKSPVPLTEDEKEEIRAKLEKQKGHRVVTECSVDPSIIGGIVLEIDGVMLDGSLRNSLREAKEVMADE